MTHRYIRLTGLANGAEIRTANFEGSEHLVVPVVALVGDSVVRPVNAEGPEFVPAEELSQAPKGWNGRPVLPDHPDGGRSSANEPETLEAMSFGVLFGSRFEEGRLKTDAWLNPERASKVGRDAQRVIERVRAGEMVEVSIGAWITAESISGTFNGERYESVWRDIVPDHLAMLPEGTEGACSIDMGCGAPRVNRATSQLRAAVKSRARRPTYSGTESTSWSAPTFAQYVSALFDGDDPPSSVGGAPASLKRRIASMTLLGDPAADNFRDLSFFPVVRPSSGRLNEGALRAVIGGRGSQANIPAAARESAQNMARRLLNSEFDADLEVNMSKLRGVLLKAMTWFREAQDEGTSVNTLYDSLWQALRGEEAAFDGIADIFPDTGKVVYGVSPEGEIQLFRRSFEVNDEGVVSLKDDRERVEARTEYQPVAARGADDDDAIDDVTDDTEGKTQPATASASESASASAGCPCNNRGEREMEQIKELVGRLIANEATPFTDEDSETLSALSEEKLASIEEQYSLEEIADEDTEPKTEEEWMAMAPESLRSMIEQHKADEKAKREKLVASLKKAQEVYDEEQLKSKSIEDLQGLAKMLKVNEPVPDFSGRVLAGDDEDRAELPEPYSIALGRSA